MNVEFTIPGATEPADIRDVVQYVLDGLRSRYIDGTNHEYQPINLQKAFLGLGFTISEAIFLNAFLQKTGLLVRISQKQSSTYCWFVSDTKNVKNMPIEVFEAHERDVIKDNKRTADLRKMRRQLENGSTRITVADEDFLVEVDAKVSAITTARDEAIQLAKALKDQIKRLTDEIKVLKTQPKNTAADAEILRKAFLERLGAMSKTPTVRPKPKRK